MTISINYSRTQAPVESVDVSNPKGYLNLRVSAETFARNGRRFKIESLNSDGSTKNAVFIHANTLESFLEALDVVNVYGVDVNS